MLWDLSSLAVGQILSVVLGFAGFAYLARTLPLESYGLVEYAVGLAGLAAIVIEGGMGTIGTLSVSRDPSRSRELAGTVAGARLLVALVVVPAVGLSSTIAGFDSRVTALIWLFAVSLLAVPFKQDWLLQGLERMTFVAPAQALKSAAFAIGVLVAVRGPDDLVNVGIIEAAAAFIGALYFVAIQRALAVPLVIDLHLRRAWSLIRTGAAVGASNLLWPFMISAPILLVTNIAGSAEAGWLGGAQRIVVALVSFSALYFFNLYPLLARGLVEDRAAWQRLIGSSFRVVAWASIGLALATTLAAGAVMSSVFGAQFMAAAPVLAIYIWLLPLRLLSGHARWTLLAAERQGVLLGVETGCAAAIVLLCAALVPRYGAAGAAASCVLGNIIGWYLAHTCASRFVGPLPGLRQVLGPLGAAALGAAAAAPAGGRAVLGLGLSVGVYALCMRIGASGIMADAVRLAYAKKDKAQAHPHR